MEAIILLSFIGVQVGAHFLPRVCGKVGRYALVQRVSKSHYLIWLVHPVVLHGLHDYAIHFVIYSGYIIQSH